RLGSDPRLLIAAPASATLYSNKNLGLHVKGVLTCALKDVLSRRHTRFYKGSRTPLTDQLLDECDMAGAETWHRILNAIERLQAKAPAEGEKVHRQGNRTGWNVTRYPPQQGQGGRR